MVHFTCYYNFYFIVVDVVISRNQTRRNVTKQNNIHAHIHQTMDTKIKTNSFWSFVVFVVVRVSYHQQILIFLVALFSLFDVTVTQDSGIFFPLFSGHCEYAHVCTRVFITLIVRIIEPIDKSHISQ